MLRDSLYRLPGRVAVGERIAFPFPRPYNGPPKLCHVAPLRPLRHRLALRAVLLAPSRSLSRSKQERSAVFRCACSSGIANTAVTFPGVRPPTHTESWYLK